MNKLNKQAHVILKKISGRKNNNYSIWFNCNLEPKIGDCWACFICNKEILFKSSILEIDEHGLDHLKDKNILVFI